MNTKKLISTVALYTILLTNVNSVYAVTTPTFPTCANPQGTVKVSYESGTHGVVGNSATFTGRDTVYTLSENTLMQCLCPTNGEGIQTNWLNASGYTQDEINILISQGWILVPNGSAWGLASSAYLAKNINYSCTSTTVGGGSGGSSNTGSSSTGGSSNTGSSAAASTGQILGLASTGNAAFIASVFMSGFLALSLGLFLKAKKNKA